MASLKESKSSYLLIKSGISFETSKALTITQSRNKHLISFIKGLMEHVVNWALHPQQPPTQTVTESKEPPQRHMTQETECIR